MNSRKPRPESPRVVFTTGLTNHMKPQVSGAGKRRKPKGERSSLPSSTVTGKGTERGTPRAKVGSKTEGPITAEPVAGWVSRGEALALLELDDAMLLDLIKAFKLSRNWVEVYSKAEILALRAIVKALR
jgi:hypothetical protein